MSTEKQKYYVSGCKDNGGDIETCDDSEATFWTLYERKENGLSHALLDCTDRLGAEAAMAVYVERDALQEQVQKLAAENAALKSAAKEVLDHWAAAEPGEMEPMMDKAIPYLREAYCESPTTDAIQNDLRAEGIYFAANRMLAAWDSGFIDDTPAQAYDISGAVLSAVEFLPNASPAEFKRDFADEIRREIKAADAGEVS